MKIKTTRASAIGRIAARARRLHLKAGEKPPENLERILWAYHQRHPLRLTALAKTSDVHLLHDVCGIYWMRPFWTPRYLASQ